MPTIYESIKADHDEHRKLLATIIDTEGDSATRRKAWYELYYDVKSHAAAEEETFYSKLMATEEGQDDARHSVSEHKEMDDLLEELNKIDMSSSAWLTRFRQLKHDYEHHMDEEEEEIFAKARREVHDDTDGKIASQFKERKEAERELVDQKAAESLEQ